MQSSLFYQLICHAAYLTVTQLQKLLEIFETFEKITCAKKNALIRCGLHDFQINKLLFPDKNKIEKSLQWTQKKHHTILCYVDDTYPFLLKQINDPPLLLFVKGDANCLNNRQLALVGSRHPSHDGLDFAKEFAFSLAGYEFTITSGLAIGVDTEAHAGALAGNGKTIAVLGSGLTEIYPKQNKTLAEKISENGAVVSEFQLDEKPVPMHFPQRNRIISGLSLGTLVIEAALKSGSLITAHYAMDQNREVFAIPGSLRNPKAKGCLQLIQKGAKCVVSVQDILDELDLNLPLLPSRKHFNVHNKPFQLDCTIKQVLACIGYEITTVDQICARSKLSAQVVTKTLFQLELEGVVKKHFQGFSLV